MKLRRFKDEDSAVIASWITNETTLYKWSADRLGQYPLPADALISAYAESEAAALPLCAVNDKGEVIGHLFIRHPDKNDSTLVRFGFVIIDPAHRGKGLGKEMIKEAISFSEKELHAKKITLGVFLNNESAKYCYEAAGFHSTGIIHTYPMEIGSWDCLEMELIL